MTEIMDAYITLMRDALGVTRPRFPEEEPKADTLPPIVRPNGKPYRPRRLRVVGWDCEDDVLWQVAVLGTHDIDKARELAPQGYHCPYLINPETGWVRLGMDHGEPRWIHDDVRGAACVIFDESDDPPEVAAALRGDQP